jgi:hypothetical protein
MLHVKIYVDIGDKFGVRLDVICVVFDTPTLEE